MKPYKVLFTLYADGSNGCRTYELETALPFVPHKGMEIEFCECCSGYDVGSIIWNNAKSRFEIILRWRDTGRPNAHWHDRHTHAGFKERKDCRDEE